MPGSFLRQAAPFRGRVAAAVVAVALAATVLTGVPSAFGIGSLPGLAVLGAAALVAGALLLYHAPWATVILAPGIIPLPLVGYLFPYEAMLVLVFALVLLATLRPPARELWRGSRLELAYLAFLGWAVFTGFWCHDGIRYALGVRRLGFGLLALWCAQRLWRLAPRAVFQSGLVLCALTISLATLAKRVSTGFDAQRALISRGTATDLGWGWANYIAALLLILTPFVIHAAFYQRERALRVLAWVTLPMLVAVQLIVVARGALLLFAGGVLFQLTAARKSRRLWGLLGGALFIAVLLVGPWGQAILTRFTSLRELSSGTIRLWYFREGWQRTLDNLPWGIGLQQGFSYPDKLQGLDPHNYWLDLASELGVLGPLLWVLVLVMVWRRIDRVARHPGMEGEGLALRVAFVVSQVHTLVEPTFQGTQYGFLFLWMTGAYFGYRRQELLAAAPAAPE